MKLSIIIFFFAITSTSFGQLVQEFDTLSFNERMNGGIDSIDISGADTPTTFDGGVSILSPTGLSVQRLVENYTTPNFLGNQTWDKMSFSALPHLGFSYAFGSQSSQFLNARYEQSFSDSLILNIDYKRTSGLGVIRNAAFNTDNVSAQLQHLGKIYSFTLKGRFVSNKINHPGGITTDTLIQDFGLEFSPVLKNNALSKNKQGVVEWNNYFDFDSDSIRSIGLVTKHKYQIKNRVYIEEDTLYGLYSNVYIDSFSTRDIYNLATISNGVGAYWRSENLYIDVLGDYNYWEYSNLNNHNYVNEISVHSNAYFKLNKLKLENAFYYNLSGAFNEFSNNLKANLDYNRFVFSGSASIERLAPTGFQRLYSSNNIAYEMNEFKLQKWSKASLDVLYNVSSKIKVSAFTSVISISSVYLFDGVIWNLDDTQRSISSIGIRSELKFGAFNIHPRFVYSSDQQNLLPQIQASSRIFLQGKVFKAKKLEIAGG